MQRTSLNRCPACTAGRGLETDAYPLGHGRDAERDQNGIVTRSVIRSGCFGETLVRVLTCPVCHADKLTVAPYKTWPAPDGVELAPPYEDVLGVPSYEV